VNPISRQCPFCAKPTFGRAARCVHCDRSIVEIHQREEERAVNCPDCGKVAEIVRLGTLELDLCDACGGLWFDRNELERLPREVPPEDLSGEVHALVARLAARKSASKAYPLCPICHETMNLAQYQKVSGVLVHRCATCGVWLDGANAAKFFFLFEAGRLADFEQRASRANAEELEARVANLEKQQSLPPPSCVVNESLCVDSGARNVSLLFDLLGFLGSFFG